MSVPAAHLDDGELLLKAAAGDGDAVRQLLADIGPVVYGFVFARVGGDQAAAEDVVQDTLLEVMRAAASYRGDAALSTWVCAIARRRVARHWEAERRAGVAASASTQVHESSDQAGEQLRPDPAAGAAFDELDERDVVIRALGQLPAEHRHVLVLKYLDGEPVAAIAEHLGRSRVSVQSMLQRARDGLREILEEEK